MGFDMTVSGPGATRAVHAMSRMTLRHTSCVTLTELSHTHNFMNGALRSSVVRGLSTSQSRLCPMGCSNTALTLAQSAQLGQRSRSRTA